ncbi:MAG: hypothetical protein GX595_07130 [Lentisphaerae bacterium]|nr:hypothetical protein [Lentisphaerota bacterium]
MDIVFSFDSEDYLTPEAADAERWWAEALRSRGVRGCFQLVAELVRSLKRTGRHDVLDAYRYHETDFHSNDHSVPPSLPERVDGKGLAESIEIVLRAEAAGVLELVETFGRLPVTYCAPGDSWSPATLVAMAMLGVRAFCNTPIVRNVRVPYWYCGSMVFNYDIGFESFFGKDDQEFKDAFSKAVEAIRRVGGSHLVIYTHPTRLVTARFWDAIFAKGTAVPPAARPPAPLRPPAEIAAIKASVERRLDWLLTRPDLHPTTFGELYARHSRDRMDLQAIMDRAGLRPGEEGRLAEVTAAGTPYLTQEALAAFAYHWVIYREGFVGKSIVEQAQRLAWTSAPARGPTPAAGL